MAAADSKPPSDDEQPSIPSVLFYHRHRRVFVTPLDTCLEIGRQRSGEPKPTTRNDRVDSARIVFAPLDDVDVSRSHLQIKPIAGAENVEVTNLSRTQPVRLDSEQVLAPGDTTVADVPVLLQFSSYAVRIEPPEDEDLELQPLPERTMVPGRQSVESNLGRLNIDTMDERLLLRWLETVLGVFQSAASSRDFPEEAAKALVKIVGLDAAAMLECDADGRWKTAALYSASEGHNEKTWIPSQTLLAEVRKEKRTFRHVPGNVPDTAQSLQNVSALVSAPILDGEGNVIGALYGDRRSGSSESHSEIPDITLFEAKLVEVLASGIAAGLARVKEQKAAMAARVQLEQFVTPKIAFQLEQDPQLLEGRDAVITVMFADIRGFSRISERLGPERTMAWIQDTMGTLSNCVLACDGTLVDYVGDELMAMWGAPLGQTNHAELACRAATEMLGVLPEITERWQHDLGTSVELGIGINSGVARVGNTGSRQRLKYGPLGDPVNMASRVQGATKYLGADCLFTGSTLEALTTSLPKRRLARVQVINIEHPVDIYELPAGPGDEWDELQRRYEEALSTLENQNVGSARELATQLALDYPHDRATTALLARLESAGQSDGEDTADTSIWCLPGK
ncbi:MAG: adenylate/guanylate cyclase domain-containing protein [Planctomycetota bacterium]